MNASPYVRHTSSCPKASDRSWKRCRCPKWLFISGDGHTRRISARTRCWERAEQIAQQIREGKTDPSRPDRVSLSDAIEQFVKDKEAQNVSDGYVSHINRILTRNLLRWCKLEGIVYLDQVTLPVIERYRQTWTYVNYGRQWFQGKLKEFFGYCVKHGWMKSNPVELLSSVKVRKVPTGYFPPEQMQAILDAVPQVYPRQAYKTLSAEFLSRRLRAFILLLRWSGLRLSDALSLGRTSLSDDGKLLLYVAKTGEPVFVPLPPDVAAEIRAIPGDRYFFWTGRANLGGASKNWGYAVGKVLKKAGIKGHPHMFRDTFAVELLLAGVPIERVSMLLGHSSVAITQKHYAPWVRARQQQLEDSVRKSWQ
jgi:integrase